MCGRVAEWTCGQRWSLSNQSGAASSRRNSSRSAALSGGAPRRDRSKPIAAGLASPLPVLSRAPRSTATPAVTNKSMTSGSAERLTDSAHDGQLNRYVRPTTPSAHAPTTTMASTPNSTSPHVGQCARILVMFSGSSSGALWARLVTVPPCELGGLAFKGSTPTRQALKRFTNGDDE